MNKKYILVTLLVGFIAGIAYVGIPKVFGVALQNPGTKFAGSYLNKELLSATSTSQNPSRNATSTPLQIAGAKKVVFQFSVKGTTTVSSADFLVYVSPLAEVPETNSELRNLRRFGYELFTDLVATNGTSPTTGDTYFARTGSGAGTTVSPAANLGATTTVAMDLTYGAWRSLVVVASSSRHDPATATALVEF